jgi:prephenate dehydrogenase
VGDRVVIAGLGLIGGSIGMALRQRGWHVAFVDPAVSIEDARRAGAADEKRESAAGEVVILATPVNIAIEQVRSAAGFMTSTCSVMEPLRAAAKSDFVAGHPFAGSEKSGLAAASAALFEGKPWFVDSEDARVKAIIEACGARQVVVDAKEHDEMVALTSHLPQIVSTALGSMLADVDPVYVGSGAKSLLRLAGSSYEVWKPVLEANEGNVRAAVRRLIKAIHSIDAEAFERAKNWQSGVRRAQPPPA